MSKRPVPRDAKGRFQKGSSGNRLGRPPLTKRQRTAFDIRQDFLNLASSPITITERGKRKTVSISHALDRQQVQLALTGNRLALQQFKQREERYASEAMVELLDLLEELLKGEKAIRDFPEDVTDRFLSILQQARRRLKDYGID